VNGRVERCDGAIGISARVGGEEAQGARGDEFHAECAGARLDPVAGGEFGVFDPKLGVLTLKNRRLPERSADVAVELEQPELDRDDPDQREGDERDRKASAHEPVDNALLEQAMAGDLRKSGEKSGPRRALARCARPRRLLDPGPARGS